MEDKNNLVSYMTRRQWKTISMKGDLNGRQPQWKTTSMEDDFNGREPINQSIFIPIICQSHTD